MPPEALAPEEWDFRRVGEDQLDAAILYEYARSCDWLLKAVKQWHEAVFRPTGKSAELRKWADRSVSELLHRPLGQELPQEVGVWVSETMPRELFTLTNISPLFPKPFLQLESPQTALIGFPRFKKCSACWEDKGNGIPLDRFINMRPDERGVGEGGQERDFLRRVVVDWRFSKTKIKEDFSAWVDRFDDRNIQKLDLGTGVQASRPWHQLKELAAHRLARQTTIKFANVRTFIKRHRETTPLADIFGVLPDYGPAGFSDAVKNAEQRIQTLYPNPGSPKKRGH